MNILHKFIAENIVEALGWTILHSLWQGAAVALVLGLLLVFTVRSFPALRYAFGIAALAIMLGAAGFTFSNYYHVSNPPSGNLNVVHYFQTGSPDYALENALTGEQAKNFHSSGMDFRTLVTGFFNLFYRHLYLLVLVYLTGVLFFVLKFFGGVIYTRRLKNYRVQPVPVRWQELFRKLCDRLNISKPVRFYKSYAAKVPMLIGYLKPVILIPASALTNLSVSQLETIVLHELAHVIRRDYLVNILQSLVEVLFFYHPAVWWISGIIRTEREHSCDDIAVKVSGDKLNFVKALAAVQEQILLNRHIAMTLTGGRNNVLKRIQRILNQPIMKIHFMERFTASCVIFAAILILVLNTGITSAGDAIRNETFLTGQIPEDTIRSGSEYLEDNLMKLEQEDNTAGMPDKHVTQGSEEELPALEKEAQAAQVAAENAEKEAQLARKEARQKRTEAENARKKKKDKLREAEDAERIAELKRAEAENAAARAEILREKAGLAREKAITEAPPEAPEPPDVQVNEEEIQYRVQEELKDMDIDKIVEESLADAQAGLDEANLNKIIQEALQGVKYGIQEADADRIADEVAHSVEVAINETDFNKIADEILSAVQTALIEINVDKIIRDVKIATESKNSQSFRGNSEHLNILLKGVGEWNKWRDENPQIAPDLTGATLTDAKLVSADLHDALLDHADLKEAVLDWADLQGASMEYANLKEASLNGARLMRANLTGADMKEVKLEGQLLRNIVFTSANLKEADLSNADLRDCDFRSANLNEANLVKADLRGADLRGAIMGEAVLTGANLRGAIADQSTIFPPGFDPEKEGVYLR